MDNQYQAKRSMESDVCAVIDEHLAVGVKLALHLFLRTSNTWYRLDRNSKCKNRTTETFYVDSKCKVLRNGETNEHTHTHTHKQTDIKHIVQTG